MAVDVGSNFDDEDNGVSIMSSSSTVMSMKDRKEAFVTGHSGSDTPWEVLWVCSTVVWGCWLYSEVIAAGSAIRKTKKDVQKTAVGTVNSSSLFFLSFVSEAAVVWFPMIVAQSRYLYPYGTILMTVQIGTAMTLLLCRSSATTTRIRTKTEIKEEIEKERDNKEAASSVAIDTTTTVAHQSEQQRLDYLTLYRSSVYYLTFIAILLVDFPAFPRRFCKTEISGYGFMDVGAASFCVSGGIVSGKNSNYGSSGVRSSRSNNDGKAYKRNYSFYYELLKPVMRAAPLVIIGIIRTVTNKELEYQEHVTEYGVHWNFFFTLGALAVITTIQKRLLFLFSSIPRSPFLAVTVFMIQSFPFVAMIIYQYALISDEYDLQKFVETAPRSVTLTASNDISYYHYYNCFYKFFVANREGILGIVGYLFLHSSGEWIGRNCVFVTAGDKDTTDADTQVVTDNDSDHNGNQKVSQRRHDITIRMQRSTPLSSSLGVVATALWFLHFIIERLFVTSANKKWTVSRRTTNLSFCLWSLAHNVTILWGMKVVSTTMAKRGRSSDKVGSIIPQFWDVVNRNGIVSFLIANILTGLVNLSIPTIDITDDRIAIAIVFAYICVVGIAVMGMDHVLRGRGNSSSSSSTITTNKFNKKKTE